MQGTMTLHRKSGRASCVISITIILMLCQLVLCYPDGNIPNRTCGSMRPEHGFTPQSTESPYVIQPNTLLFIPHHYIIAELFATGETPFKGFYCQARVSDQVVGNFISVDDDNTTRGHDCYYRSPAPGSHSTVSHTLVWRNSPEESLDLYWMTEDEDVESFKFRCTFVQQRTTFWVGVESPSVTSLVTKSVEECCQIDNVPESCQVLCRPVNEQPEDIDAIIEAITTALEDETCYFEDVQRALRCSHWALNARDDGREDDDTDSPDSSGLRRCCERGNVTESCQLLCDIHTIAEMIYDEDELFGCMGNNSGLASCLLYPANAEDDENDAVSEATSSIPFRGQSSTPEITRSSSLPITESVRPLTTMASTTSARPRNGATTKPESTTTDYIPQTTTIHGVQDTTSEDYDVTTTPYSENPTTTTSNYDKQTTDDDVTSAKNIMSTARPHDTTFKHYDGTATAYSDYPTTRTSHYDGETTIAEVTSAENGMFASTKPTVPNVVHTPSPTMTAGTTPSDPVRRIGVVVFDITTTVDVVGATENQDLKNRVLNALGTNLLIPGLGGITGYVKVAVGVETYSGSLIVVSEGIFSQQDDGSIPTIGDIQDSLHSRLDEIKGQISDPQTNEWRVERPIVVEHKVINGLCNSNACGEGKVCVEVGSDAFTCVCVDGSGDELPCATDDGQTGVSGGAIAGIVVGLAVLAAIVCLLCREKIRRGIYRCRQNAERRKRKASVKSDHSYVSPDNIVPNPDPIYMDITDAGSRPPPLPVGNKATLPSNSMTYDTPDYNGSKKMKHGSESDDSGYMKPNGPDVHHTPDTGEYEKPVSENEYEKAGNARKKSGNDEYDSPYTYDSVGSEPLAEAKMKKNSAIQEELPSATTANTSDKNVYIQLENCGVRKDYAYAEDGIASDTNIGAAGIDNTVIASAPSPSEIEAEKGSNDVPYDTIF